EVAQIKEALQKMQQQLQRSMDENIQKAQHSKQEKQPETQQQTQNSQQQQQQQLQQQIQQLQTRDKINYRTLIHFRIQALLNASSQELTKPRLFVVLPTDYGLVCGQGGPYVLDFRLYFLCECKNTKTSLEVHRSDNEGYSVDNPKEFFGKYGSYVLAMMYMVKDGTMGAGLVVPPLVPTTSSTSSTYLSRASAHPSFVKKDINRLVDDTIDYPEGMTHDTNINEDPASHWNVSLPDLGDLISYLKVDKDESAS
ncbi:hypothetical protein BGZ65_012233, partial [Modicella reniformis]